MPFGDSRDVREAVKHIIRTVGRGGGLLIAPIHAWNLMFLGRIFWDAVDDYRYY